MRKKIVVLLTVALLLAVMAFTLCACNNEERVTELDYIEKLHNEGYVICDIQFDTRVDAYEGTFTADPSTRRLVYTCVCAMKESEKIEIYFFKDNDAALDFFNSNQWLSKIYDGETGKSYVEGNKVFFGTNQACEDVSNVTCSDKGRQTPTEYYKKLIIRKTDDYGFESSSTLRYDINSAEEQKSIDFVYFRSSLLGGYLTISFFFDSNDANAKYSELKDEYSKDGLKIVLRDNALIYGNEQIVNDAIE